MADYSTLLRDHVTLTCRSIDRIFLQAYVPKLQTVGWVCSFLRWQRGFPPADDRTIGNHALVLGGTMAGLLAARVLAEGVRPGDCG